MFHALKTLFQRKKPAAAPAPLKSRSPMHAPRKVLVDSDAPAPLIAPLAPQTPQAFELRQPVCAPMPVEDRGSREDRCHAEASYSSASSSDSFGCGSYSSDSGSSSCGGD